MPIKNYTTEVPASRSINEIQDALVKHGATGLMFEYDQGRIAALRFLLPVQGQEVTFSLPVHWRKFQRVLELQKVGRSKDEDYVYRVAWRCIRDWVMAQLALYETQIVEMPQIFLPFATYPNGKTLYENIIDGKFLLGDGREE